MGQIFLIVVFPRGPPFQTTPEILEWQEGEDVTR